MAFEDLIHWVKLIQRRQKHILMFFLHLREYGEEKNTGRYIEYREILNRLKRDGSILNQNQGPEKIEK